MTALQLVEWLFTEAESPKKFFRQRRTATNRIPQPHEVEYELEADWEEDSPEGHFEDPDDIAFVRQQIENGNVWGWCSTHVIAKWTDAEGNEYHGDAYLGGCSYRNRRDFMEPGGYYDDMKQEAYDDLAKQLLRAGFKQY